MYEIEGRPLVMTGKKWAGSVKVIKNPQQEKTLYALDISRKWTSSLVLL